MDIEMQNNEVVNNIHSDILYLDAERSQSRAPQNVSSLPVMSIDKNTSDPLLDYCSRNREVYLFLRLTASYWPTSGSMWTLDRLYFIFTRSVNVLSVILNFIYIWLILFSFHYDSQTLRWTSAGIDLAIVIRTISVLPVQYFNQQRLYRLASPQDTIVLSESVRVATVFGLISTTATFLGMMLMFFGTMPTNSISFLTEYFLGAYLTFNMFFLILDIKVSSLLLDQLHLLADSRQLTMDTFQAVKTEIHRRVGESRWASDLIIVPCIASVVAIAVLVLFFLDKGVDAMVTRDTVAFIAYMIKELLFVAVAFWYIAQVNAKADELTAKLSRSVWGVYSVDVESGSSKQQSTRGSPVTVSTQNDSSALLLSNIPQLPDIYRLSIHASSVSEPISFTLLFKRLTWLNVAVSAGGFCFTLLIALIKSLLGF